RSTDRAPVATPSGWLQRLMAGPPIEAPAPGVGAPFIEGRVGHRSEFAGYEVTGILGQGGMGVVYDARHRQLDRPVAIKVIRPKLMSAKDAQRRFRREIQVLGRLNHPGIVAATDAGNMGSAAYLVMERVEGVDLARLVRHAGPLSI